MSLYRPAGNANGKISPFWSAQFRGPASRVVSVSTNIRDKRTAKRLEAVWVGAAELGRNGHLTIDRAKQLLDECAQICRGDSLKQSEGFIDSCLRQSTGAGLNIPMEKRKPFQWLILPGQVGVPVARHETSALFSELFLRTARYAALKEAEKR